MVSLLDKAQSTPKTKTSARYIVRTKEHQDLALQWAAGKVTYTQAATALGMAGSRVYAILALTRRSRLRDR